MKKLILITSLLLSALSAKAQSVQAGDDIADIVAMEAMDEMLGADYQDQYFQNLSCADSLLSAFERKNVRPAILQGLSMEDFLESRADMLCAKELKAYNAIRALSKKAQISAIRKNPQVMANVLKCRTNAQSSLLKQIAKATGALKQRDVLASCGSLN